MTDWTPQSQPGYGMACGKCSKPLSPAWRGRCQHCRATFADYPPVKAEKTSAAPWWTDRMPVVALIALIVVIAAVVLGFYLR